MKPLALLLLCCSTWAGAQELPAARLKLSPALAPSPASTTVRAIRFEGNEVTQPRTMLREMVIAPGDLADPARIERSRQAVQDLGLFKSVSVREEPVNGGVDLVFKVRERWYLLPIPRLDAKATGEYSYGGQVRWNNVWGLDHTLRLTYEREDRQKQGVGLETSYNFGYSAPQVFDSRYSVGIGAGHTRRPRILPDGRSYEEQLQNIGVGISRSLSEGPPSQGWSVSAGLLWQDQDTSGVNAIAPYGMATAPELGLRYRDLHLRIYSEEGISYGGKLQFAVDGWAADYGYSELTAGYAQYIPVGSTEYQTLHLFAELGLRSDGPPLNDAFTLGGNSLLRGYEKDFLEGDAVYRVAAEFARPVFRRWLRWVLIAEAGSVFEEPDDIRFGRVYTSVGAALRVRFSTFVNLEIEAGVALPVGDDGGLRFFAGRI
ncbi:MAG TPA: BamA/TamA family outer membrane protein [Solimonas sp.]|nr:BamA/TamA family outer membrane protein [Solimonas sp.]